MFTFVFLDFQLTGLNFPRRGKFLWLRFLLEEEKNVTRNICVLFVHGAHPVLEREMAERERWGESYLHWAYELTCGKEMLVMKLTLQLQDDTFNLENLKWNLCQLGELITITFVGARKIISVAIYNNECNLSDKIPRDYS